MEAIIKAQNLNFTYNQGKDNEYQALININFEIYPEEFIIIFGPSGCGKSTLLNVIAGLERPAQNTTFVFGQDMFLMSKYDFAMYHRTQIGMVYQQYNLITSLSVLDNVALPQMFIDVHKGRRNQWARQLLERFGILKQAKKIPSELSGGQQQRIGIARSIVNDPKLILADEPVGNLDSVSAKNVLDILQALNEKEKKTVILVTHNPENLVYGDRIFYMKDGIITREVVNRDKHKADKRELAPKSPTAEINDLLRAYHGLTPEQINILIMPYKAKAFAHHFIASRSLEETRILEDIIQRRLLGTISQEEFYEILHKNSLEGGVGFDIRTAEKILRRVNRIIRTAYYIYQEERQRTDELGGHEKINDDEKAKKVTWYLLGACYYKHYKNLDEVQINRLQLAVKERLTGVLQKNGYYEQLDKPFKTGGVGLNSKTAKAMTEELELILILGFGIVQRLSMEEHSAETAPADTGEKPKPAPELSAVEKNIAAQIAAEPLQADTADKDSDSKSETKPASVNDSDAPKDEASPPPAADEQTQEKNPEAEAPTADNNGSEKKDNGRTLYLTGEEAAQLAQTGMAYEAPPSQEDLLKNALNADKLAAQAKEAEELTAASEEALKNISPKVSEYLKDYLPQNDGQENEAKPAEPAIPGPEASAKPEDDKK